VVNNIVYVGSDRGKLYGLDTATGQVVWSTTAGNSIPYVDEHNGSRPTAGLAAAEGLLVIPTDTTLVAYEEDHTPPSVRRFRLRMLRVGTLPQSTFPLVFQALARQHRKVRFTLLPRCKPNSGCDANGSRRQCYDRYFTGH
jgi:hypothetical protein